MENQQKVDGLFLSAVNVIANKYGCNNIAINLDNHTVQFNCEPEKELAIAEELTRLFG